MIIGLFSGGGVLGEIGGVLGINTDKQQAAVAAQGKDALEIQKRNRGFELEDRASFEEDKSRAIEVLFGGSGAAAKRIGQGRDISEELIRGGTGQSIATLLSGRNLGQQSLTEGVQNSIASLLGGKDIATEALLGSTRGSLSQFREALSGLDFGEGLARGATAEGFGANIANILEGGALDPLISQRQKSASSALASAGLSRSNVAAERAAEIPADLAFNLESLLTGRQQDQFQTGLGARRDIASLLESSGINLANLATGTAGSVAGLQEGLGINLANLQTGTAGNVAGLQEGLGLNLANLAGGAETNLANLATGTSQTIANVLGQQPKSLTPFVQTTDPIALAQLETQRNQNIIGLLGGAATGGILGGAGILGSSIGGGAGAGLGILGALSDIRLKENVTPVGAIRDLTVYEWDWFPEVLNIDKEGILTGMTRGFIAQEVFDIYPEFVGEFAGYMTIDYKGLLGVLEGVH